MIHIGPEPHCQGSGSFTLRGGGGSRKLAVALLGAHHLEKSAPSFMNTSILRLAYWQMNLREFGASSLRKRSS